MIPPQSIIGLSPNPPGLAITRATLKPLATISPILSASANQASDMEVDPKTSMGSTQQTLLPDYTSWELVLRTESRGKGIRLDKTGRS